MPQRRARNATAHVMWSEDGYRPRSSTVSRMDQLRAMFLDSPAKSHIIRELMHLKELGLDPSDPDLMDRAIALGFRRHADEIGARERLASLAGPADHHHEPIVYYMRMGGLVKIGTTINITDRYSAIYPEEVMAVEPGDASLERRRHQQFAELYSHGEWFTLDERLRAHIEAVGAEFAKVNGATVESWLAERLPPRRRRFSSASIPSPSPAGRADLAFSPSDASASAAHSSRSGPSRRSPRQRAEPVLDDRSTAC